MAVAEKTLDSHIECTPGIAGGKPRIAGHRIRVQDIAIWHEQMHWTAEYIAEQFDLSLADIHAALAYYFDHKVQIDRSLREQDKFVEEMKKKSPSKIPGKLKNNSGRRP